MCCLESLQPIDGVLDMNRHQFRVACFGPSDDSAWSKPSQAVLLNYASKDNKSEAPLPIRGLEVSDVVRLPKMDGADVRLARKQCLLSWIQPPLRGLEPVYEITVSYDQGGDEDYWEKLPTYILLP